MTVQGSLCITNPALHCTAPCWAASALLCVPTRGKFLVGQSSRRAADCGVQQIVADCDCILMPASILLDPSVISELEGCRARLGKKATFEAALDDTAHIISGRSSQFSDTAVQSKLLDLLARSMTLLRTRHTSVAFWRAEQRLLAASKVGILASLSSHACTR